MLYEAFQRDAFDYFAGTVVFFSTMGIIQNNTDEIAPDSFNNVKEVYLK